MKYSKFIYQNKRKSQQKAKKVDVKEIKLRPVTDDHDLQIKAKSIIKFLGQGHRVKVSMRF